MMMRQTHTDVIGLDGSLVMRVPNCNTLFPAQFEAAAGASGSGDDDLPGDYDGWLEYAAFHQTEGFLSFLGTFSVPDQPAATPDVLYLFTGLQNIE